MPVHKSGSIQYFTHSILDGYGVKHAYFMRHGGVSPTPWKSLNMGLGRDIPERVLENRLRAFKSVKLDPDSMYDVWQIHSKEVLCIDTIREAGENYQKADGILTDNPDITLFMRFADCVPILLYDPRLKVIGILHAGWQGTLKKITSSAINKMIRVYHSEPSDIIAALGPSIGPDHYVVGDNVVQEVRNVFGARSRSTLTIREGKIYFDLWNANIILLEEAGVTQTEVSGLCTACNVDDWFSHRQENGRTGRFGAFISLNASLQS
jgi:YfiH family protein